MSKIYLSVILLLVLISCSVGPVPIYYNQPIVRLLDDTLQITFSVPDTDSDGWENHNWNDQGEDSVYLYIDAEEIKNFDAYIERIEYSVIVENQEMSSGGYDFMIPLEITDMDTLEIDPPLEILINEHLAYDIDITDGIHDNVGKGIVEIQVKYTDEKGENYSSLPIRKPFLLVKP